MARGLQFLIVFLGLQVACQKPAGQTSLAIHLIDLYRADLLIGRVKTEPPARTEWRFDGPDPDSAPKVAPSTRGWVASAGVKDFRIDRGRLTGHTTTDFPFIHVERTSGLSDRDVLYSFEIRLRVSVGTNLSLSYGLEEKLDINRVIEQARELPWMHKVPLVPGETFRSYTVRAIRPIPGSEIRHFLIRPTDAAGAKFEIESIRLIFRKEHLASIPSGIGWQGLSNIFHETLVMRAAEKFSISVTLPDRAWLDMSVGTLDDYPTSFKVAVQMGSDETILLQRTVTTSHRWEPVPLDLTNKLSRHRIMRSATL